MLLLLLCGKNISEEEGGYMPIHQEGVREVKCHKNQKQNKKKRKKNKHIEDSTHGSR